MKKIKRLLLVISLILIANIRVFAESGLEVAINVPLGASFSTFYGDIYYLGNISLNSGLGFDAGVQVQVGYMFDLGIFALSLLGDLGYSYDSYNFSYSGSYIDLNGYLNNYKVNNTLYTHSFQIGLLPKFNFGNVAWGIGGGIKVPFTGTTEVKNDINSSSYTYKENYKASNYEIPIIGYIKTTLDYSIFFNDRMALVLGLYVGYDIGPTVKGTKNRIDSFDIGGEIGFKFGPKPGY